MEQVKFINSMDITIPDSFDTTYLSKLLCMSRSKVYNLMVIHHLPYYKLNRKIVIFKQNFFEWLNNDSITPFTELQIIKSMPDLFPPLLLQNILSISKSKIYETVKKYNLHLILPGKKIVIVKEKLTKIFLKFSCC